MARDLLFDLRRGGGSALELLYGEVSISPTLMHSVSTAVVLPAPTKVDLIAGKATFTQVAPTPAPVDGKIDWAYKVVITDRRGKTWEYLVGVPDAVPPINFNVLPRYFETRPPNFGVGPQGPAGTSATVAVGTTTSGPTPAVVNSGTATNAVLDFTLAKGDKGDTGPAGSGVHLVASKLASALPDTYSSGVTLLTLGGTGVADGWPVGFAQVVTDRREAGRTTQRLTTITNSVQMTRTEQNNAWLPWRTTPFDDLASPLLNGLMSALDKAKLDGQTPAANSKTFAALASTYQAGTTTLQVRAADGWPLATTGTLVTQKTATGNNGVGQWLLPVEGGAPLYRVSGTTGVWLEFSTTATEAWVTTNKDYLTPEQFGAVGDNVTDDAAAVTAALAASSASGKSIVLSAVYYVSTLSQSFWRAGYEGTGGLRVGSNSTSHRPNPTNNGLSFPVYYDNNTGSDSNSGLDPANPVKTFSSFITNYTIYMGRRQGNLGAITLQVANGIHKDTFRSVGTFPLTSVRFWLQGESRAGAIIDGTGTSNSVGIWVEPGSFFGVRNITVQNFKSPDTEGDDSPDNGAAIVHKGGGDVRVENVNVKGCSQGVGFINGTVGTLINSLIEDCQTGVRILYGSSGLVSSSTIRNCTVNGVFVSRNAVTHVDYNIIESCAVGISVNMASRNATLGGEFKNNGLGVLTSGAGEVIISEATAFTGNTRDRAYYGVGRETRIQGNSPTTNEWCLAKTSSVRFHSGTTTNTTIYSPGSSIMVYPRHHTTPNSKLRMKLYGETGGAGTKTLRFYSINPRDSSQINLLSTAVIPADHTGNFELDLENWGVSSLGNLGKSRLEVSGKPAILASASNTADTSYTWSFRIMAQNSDSAGFVSLQVAELYLMG